MSILSLSRHIRQSVSGETEGYAILNPLGALWANRIWPTREAAQAELKAHGPFSIDLQIVPAKQTIVWDRD